MKRITLVGTLALFAAFAVSSALGGVTDDAFANLSVAEQLEFVRTMNATLPDFRAKSDQSRTELAYRLNRDFIRAAKAVDRRRILAEVFATAPEFALPALADGLSSEVFNRSSAGFRKDDDSFQNFALSAMLGIYRRCRSDNSLDLSNQRRIAFAVVMFLKASEGEPRDFFSQLIVFVPDVVRDIARKEWIPQAMGAEGRKPTYEPILQASTNDTRIAKAEIPNENPRVTLKMPNSEQAVMTVRALQEIDKSVLLLAPNFDDEYSETPIAPKEGTKESGMYDGQPY